MKTKVSISIILSFIFVMMLSVSCEREKTEWKGTIEEEDGVKVIKNPNEPLYGEITFDLEEDLKIGNEDDENYMFYRIRGIAVDNQGNIYVSDMSNYRIQKFDKNGRYLMTIGRKGQGPGDFELPTLIRINHTNGDIFVKDTVWAIDIFSKQGQFINTIKLNKAIQDFFPFEDNTILAFLEKSSDEELRGVNILCKIDVQGKILNSIAEFPLTRFMGKMSTGGVFTIGTGFELSIHFAISEQDKIAYGYSKEYELRVINREGKLLYLIRKDDLKPRFTSEEKSEFKRIKIPVPEFKPYYYSIFSDSKGRIYVQGNKTEETIRGYGPIDKIEKKVDIFSKDGYFLYNANLPPNTCVIREGFLYSRDLDEDKGIEYVKRYKIKNWEQIKTGI